MRSIRSLNDVRDKFAGPTHVAPLAIYLREITDFDFSLVGCIVIGRNLVRIDVDGTVKEVCLERSGFHYHNLNSEGFNLLS